MRTRWLPTETARAAGCDGFISKPCLPADLAAQIAGFLKMQPEATGRKGKTHRGQ